MSNISEKHKWSIYRSIRNGAVIGILFSFYSLYQEVYTSDTFTFYDMIDGRARIFAVLGEIIRGLVGGAFFFGVIAKIRNLFIK